MSELTEEMKSNIRRYHIALKMYDFPYADMMLRLYPYIKPEPPPWFFFENIFTARKPNINGILFLLFTVAFYFGLWVFYIIHMIY